MQNSFIFGLANLSHQSAKSKKDEISVEISFQKALKQGKKFSSPRIAAFNFQ